jgi:hypothetical protein
MKQRNHEHSSSDSSLDRYDNYTRKKIIKRWNEDFQVEKKIEEKKKKMAQAKIDLAIIEQKLRNKKKYDEDEKNKNYRNIKREEIYEDSDETISKGDLK